MRLAVCVAALALAALTLSGCVPTTPVAKPSNSPTPTPTSTAPPTFIAGGSAEANKPFFDYVNNALFATTGGADGETIISNLVSSGFTKATMQVTPDKTSVNGGVDSILFAVKIDSSCLLGQHGGGGYSSAVEPALANGLCLIGKTRPITW